VPKGPLDLQVQLDLLEKQVPQEQLVQQVLRELSVRLGQQALKVYKECKAFRVKSVLQELTEQLALQALQEHLVQTLPLKVLQVLQEILGPRDLRVLLERLELMELLDLQELQVLRGNLVAQHLPTSLTLEQLTPRLLVMESSDSTTQT
jgi:hypothetical protein